ncbi:hypothetical protein GCM10009837_41980 [Streptomyces durmitorensis]|uniref:Uncharacterized protein n=1 Tax=Streptomyces durmitorensis TaxID=319947 RepID=A0ABY4Q3S0_9ACTN|nr:hypothetical protein [Streptomyces durmitorensis]UQT60766.1 hypothetical protein M4V62_40040 [Streptomyces durmitorensis]
MQIQRAALAVVMSAVALGTTVGTVAAAAPASVGLRASSCGEAVRNTRADLQQAGAPTGASDWQSVRNAAQDFLNQHPWNSPGTQVLQADVNDLNRLCAS